MRRGKVIFLAMLSILSLLFAILNFSFGGIGLKGYAGPTRVFNFTALRCEPLPLDCFDDVIVESKK